MYTINLSEYSVLSLKRNTLMYVFREHAMFKETPKIKRNPKNYLYWEHKITMNHGGPSHSYTYQHNPHPHILSHTQIHFY